ncbi:MAG TPA: hypothetical protein VI932_11580 [Bacteroidota bacterium]|nr:hypothetical protein [Bacteroidota bacterium]
MIGLILVFLGRRVYLISIGILGFLGGLYLFTSFLGTAHDWRSLLFALLFGTVGSLLAFALHKAAWIFGGFCGGGVLLLYFSDATGISPVSSPVLLFLMGGTAGAILFLLLLDWALVIVTTLTGSVLMTYQSGLGGPAGQALFVGLLLLGIFVQGNSLRADRREKKAE